MVRRSGKIIGDVYIPLVIGWTILIGKQGMKSKKIGAHNELEEVEAEVVLLINQAKDLKELIIALSNSITTNQHLLKGAGNSLTS